MHLHDQDNPGPAKKAVIVCAFETGTHPSSIARAQQRTEAAIRQTLLRVRTDRPRNVTELNGPRPANTGNAESIVDQAKIVLRRRFEDRRGVWILDGSACSLARLMTEANKALAARGMPQLGRNPAWLVPENDILISRQA